jgi:TonB family protein
VTAATKAAVFVLTACLAFAANKPPTVQLGPGVFRAQVQKAIIPAYPPQSIQAGHSGVAVADVHVSSTGTVLGVILLQAPDASIGAEVIGAVSKWIFRPTLALPEKTPVEIEGRVILSFSLRGGTPRVTDLVVEHIQSTSKRK